MAEVTRRDDQKILAPDSRHLTLIELVPEALLLTDVRGVIQEANPAASRFLNVPHKILTGLPLADFIESDDLPLWQSQVHQLIESGRSDGVTLRLCPRHQAARAVSLRGILWDDSDSTRTRLLLIVQSPPELPRPVEDPARSQAFLQALSELAARMLTSLDPDRVMETLGSELKTLGLTCMVALLEPNSPTLTLRYASIESGALTLAEKMTGLKLRGFHIPSGHWPIYNEVIEQKRVVFVPEAINLAFAVLPGLPRSLIERAVTMVGVSKRTRAIYLPLAVEQRVLGAFGIWGEDLRESDVPAVSVVASQVAAALEVVRLYRLAEQAAVMEERERLAHELHDSMTQSLYSLTLFTEAARRLVKAGRLERVEEYLSQLGETAQQALKEMRLLVYHLRPSVLHRVGLVQAIQQRLNGVEKRAGINVDLRVSGSIRLTAPQAEELYYIAQEALNNALKYSGSNSVLVRLAARTQSFELEVKDNGKGFALDQVRDRGGLGLGSMSERATRIGASLVINTHLGAGTSVQVVVKT